MTSFQSFLMFRVSLESWISLLWSHTKNVKFDCLRQKLQLNLVTDILNHRNGMMFLVWVGRGAVTGEPLPLSLICWLLAEVRRVVLLRHSHCQWSAIDSYGGGYHSYIQLYLAIVRKTEIKKNLRIRNHAQLSDKFRRQISKLKNDCKQRLNCTIYSEFIQLPLFF